MVHQIDVVWDGFKCEWPQEKQWTVEHMPHHTTVEVGNVGMKGMKRVTKGRS